MKVLVIDDSVRHQTSAVQTLGTDHELTVITGHDAALEALSTYKNTFLEEGEYWDAVLSDLLMPAGANAQGGKGLEYVGVEMAVGWSLALQAAIAGAKYVAVVTDMNHHHHPASAMLDAISREVFIVQGARALFTNYVELVGIIGTEKACSECGGSGKGRRHDNSEYRCFLCKGTGVDFDQKGKDWSKVLSKIMEGPQD